MDSITKINTLHLLALANLIGLEAQSPLVVDISGTKYMTLRASMDVLLLVVMIEYVLSKPF